MIARFISRRRVRWTFLLLALGCSACRQSPTEHQETQSTTTTEPLAPADTVAPPPDPARVEAQLKAIRAVYQRIQALPLRVDTVNVDSATCVSYPALRYYQHQGQVVRIEEEGMLGDGSWTTKYYFDDGRFIFGFDVMYGGPAIGPTDCIETRTYVADGRVIRSITTRNGVIDPQSGPVSPTTAARLYQAYTRHDFVAAFCSEEN